jgi:protein gp37
MADRLAMNNKLPLDEMNAYLNPSGKFRKYLVGPPVLTHRLKDPLHWREPSRIGVQFMGDLFHERVHLDFIQGLFEIIDLCSHHTFFILTKRPTEMKSFFQQWAENKFDLLAGKGSKIGIKWPISNLFLGVTVCNQEEADKKIPILLSIPGFKKWVSYEPALEPIDLRPAFEQAVMTVNCDTPGLSWIVAGSESGPGARTAYNNWFREMLDQARALGVPFFMKQTTGPIPDDLMLREFPGDHG